MVYPLSNCINANVTFWCRCNRGLKRLNLCCLDSMSRDESMSVDNQTPDVQVVSAIEVIPIEDETMEEQGIISFRYLFIPTEKKITWYLIFGVISVFACSNHAFFFIVVSWFLLNFPNQNN